MQVGTIGLGSMGTNRVCRLMCVSTRAALFQRFSSRDEADFQDRLLSAMRFEFGGHVEKTPES